MNKIFEENIKLLTAQKLSENFSSRQEHESHQVRVGIFVEGEIFIKFKTIFINLKERRILY
jgi:hypothetical protein